MQVDCTEEAGSERSRLLLSLRVRLFSYSSATKFFKIFKNKAREENSFEWDIGPVRTILPNRNAVIDDFDGLMRKLP